MVATGVFSYHGDTGPHDQMVLKVLNDFEPKVYTSMSLLLI